MTKTFIFDSIASALPFVTGEQTACQLPFLNEGKEALMAEEVPEPDQLERMIRDENDEGQRMMVEEIVTHPDRYSVEHLHAALRGLHHAPPDSTDKQAFIEELKASVGLENGKEEEPMAEDDPQAARSPTGGWGSFVKIAGRSLAGVALAVILLGVIVSDDTSEELKKPLTNIRDKIAGVTETVTKKVEEIVGEKTEDLATSKELDDLATREDLDQIASPEDLEGLATSKEVEELKKVVKAGQELSPAEYERRKSELEKELAKTEAAIEKLRKQSGSASRLVTVADKIASAEKELENLTAITSVDVSAQTKELRQKLKRLRAEKRKLAESSGLTLEEARRKAESLSSRLADLTDTKESLQTELEKLREKRPDLSNRELASRVDTQSQRLTTLEKQVGKVAKRQRRMAKRQRTFRDTVTDGLEKLREGQKKVRRGQKKTRRTVENSFRNQLPTHVSTAYLDRFEAGENEEKGKLVSFLVVSEKRLVTDVPYDKVTPRQDGGWSTPKGRIPKSALWSYRHSKGEFVRVGRSDLAKSNVFYDQRDQELVVIEHGSGFDMKRIPVVSGGASTTGPVHTPARKTPASEAEEEETDTSSSGDGDVPAAAKKSQKEYTADYKERGSKSGTFKVKVPNGKHVVVRDKPYIAYPNHRDPRVWAFYLNGEWVAAPVVGPKSFKVNGPVDR